MATRRLPSVTPPEAQPKDPKAPRKRAKHLDDRLDIDVVCVLLEQGWMQAAIARKLKVQPADLSVWLRDEQRSVRAREARARSAANLADKAEQVLTAARSPLALGKARELAHHYRWKASKMNPGEYGDKVQAQVDLTAQVTHITCTIID